MAGAAAQLDAEAAVLFAAVAAGRLVAGAAVLLVTEAATHAEIKKAYHKTVLLIRESAAIE